MVFRTSLFGKGQTARNETLFTTGNGSLGFRGDTEEKGGTVHKGTYINGFYDTEPIRYGEAAYGYAKNHETILNLPDPKRVELWADGVQLGMENPALVKSHSLELDTERGFMRRKTSWALESASIDLESVRLVSFENEDCAAIQYRVKNSGKAAVKIAVDSMIDTATGNVLAEEDPRIGAKFTGRPLLIDGAEAKDGALLFSSHTRNSGLFLAGCAVNAFSFLGKGGLSLSHECEDNLPRAKAEAELLPGEELLLEKYITYVWDKEKAPDPSGVHKKCLDFLAKGFERICGEQKRFLDDFWSLASISIKSGDGAEEALTFDLFHLLQSAGRKGLTSIAAKGLTSEGYEGHFFWDSESYVCPVFTYVAPGIAKSLLEYRLSTLPKARERAAELNLKGALYPWRTISGRETSAYYPAGTAQCHINADIVFAMRRFLNAHPKTDKAFKDGVLEAAAESARLYASIGNFSEAKGGAFCINDVTGPDEYTAIVNNNAYTNFMAKECLLFAAENCAESASEEERALWKNIAEKMYIPFDKKAGVYPQDDSFMDKAEWDFAGTPRENYPLLLHYHPLEIYRRRVLKQPDLVLAQFLLSGLFSRAEKKRNYDFYEKYTTGDSSLSHCIMSIMAAETGDVRKAYDYYMKTVRMDIDDVNGNSRDGIHTACMAGSWMGAVYGFAGFRDYGGVYSFEPRLPREWKELSFRLSLGGSVVSVFISRESASYSLVSGEGASLVHRGKAFTLSRGETKTFSLKAELKAVLFDLDGVITDTAALHFKAWDELCKKRGLSFDENMNKKLLGVSREDSLDIILKENGAVWSEQEKKEACEWKNNRYKELLSTLSRKDVLPGILSLLEELKKEGVKAALASSSKNAPAVLEALGLSEYFYAVADASRVQKAKPEPDIFLEAAERSGECFLDCVAIEDAQSGVDAIKKAGIKAVGISKEKSLLRADRQLSSTAELSLSLLKSLLAE